MNRFLRHQLKHFCIWIAGIVALYALNRYGPSVLPPPVVRVLSWSATLGMMVYFVLLFVAPFGLGPWGKTLSDVARQAERDRWRQ